MRQWKSGVSHRLLGAGLIIVSVLALSGPFVTGTWSLQFLSLLPLAVGIFDLYGAATGPQRSNPISYVGGVLALLAALLLFTSPMMVISGLVALLLLFLAADGIWKLGQALVGRDPNAPRVISALNGALSLLLVLIGWTLWQNISGSAAIGVAIAGYTAMAGWRMLVSPRSDQAATAAERDVGVHPDAKLGLGHQELFSAIGARQSASSDDVWHANIYWLLVVGLVLFATHLSRMQSADTWLGLISPFVATTGDILMSVALGALLVLPARLCWRWLTRPIERAAWRLRLAGQDVQLATVTAGLVRFWTDGRYSFSNSLRRARASLPLAGALVIRLGIPLTILFAAVNPIWGFNWYLNTESWASAIYEKVAELRVDTWRARMVDAIFSTYGGDRDLLFQVTPTGVDSGDFNFIVIGDTGEGDGSQYSLVERYLDLARRDDVKFIVISSDVIYPAGAMSDYENNFYLPFKGFKKPIYAIPGNHDWFDALEAFNANFLEPKAARAALAARVKADFGLTSTDQERADRLLQKAQRLRTLYGIQLAKQRAPFFELQTKDFALVAIDTGILRTIDDRQLAWLKAALERSKGKFIMAIVGHPKYAGGHDTTKNAEASRARVSAWVPNSIRNSIVTSTYAAARESSRPARSRDSLSARDLYALLERAGAQVVMAGDTHAFEYYAQESGQSESGHPVQYFVNGGGGAYLSIGGALDWPKVPAINKWAYYPGTEAVVAKLNAETPAWKWPVWFWIKHFGAWPLSVEALSSLFDFNYAPFYQSFMEVRVERSKNRIVFALEGVDGPVRWRDLDVSSEGGFGGRPDSPVEFILPLAAREN
ncbi:MAG: metallophosphoesterase [Gammaproteobacteria bacterium]